MRDERAFLGDMLESARLVEQFVAGYTLEMFVADRKSQDAVIRRLAIIGEAAKKISPETRAALPGLPFEAMSGMRDILTHVYWGVKLDIVWETATRDIPSLITSLEKVFPPPATGGTQISWPYDPNLK
jgi:uncharacterized protein with HEPN domain